eukprot:CAMPEP_0180022468 /NCGR_PEP_ID=MMETSP0984-20121128/22885_1 /TAXON_ID=483367 /ORGANISM="non described non described, Strain CCMP 2436" /LENGTH=105 /DNA_ID=CAMNT_0021946529 /DNA_START=127 /DNA_END=446 /DNA_ORIENTATION=+
MSRSASINSCCDSPLAPAALPLARVEAAEGGHPSRAENTVGKLHAAPRRVSSRQRLAAPLSASRSGGGRTVLALRVSDAARTLFDDVTDEAVGKHVWQGRVAERA